jgi:hypothetical protein
LRHIEYREQSAVGFKQAGLKIDSITMKAQTVMAEDVTFTQGKAVQECQTWIAAEFLNAQGRGVGVESRRQQRTTIDLLTPALGFWVHRHPEEHLLGVAAWKIRNPAVNDRIEREKRFLLTAGQDLPRYGPASTLKEERWNG